MSFASSDQIRRDFDGLNVRPGISSSSQFGSLCQDTRVGSKETKLAFLQFHLLRTNSPNPNFFQLWYSYQLAVSPDRIIEEVKLRTLTYQFINLNCTLSSPLMPRISEDFYLDCSLYFCWCDLILKSVSTMAKYYPLIICEREFTDKNQTISTQFRILGIWL